MMNLRRREAAGGGKLLQRTLVVLLACFASSQATAQNYVRNPDFEQPLGTNNWTVVYSFGGPSDFSVRDRTTIAHKDKVPGTWDGHPDYLDVYGAEFSPYHDGQMWAYFKQSVSGLKPGSNYVISCWMTQFVDKYTNNVQVYMETVGGTVRQTPNVYDACNNNPSAWKMYSVTNTANSSGKIDVRLHFNKNTWTTLAWHYIRAYYDHVAVMLPGETPPPFKMVSLSVTNGSGVSLKWQTLINNTYDIEGSPGFGYWEPLQTGLLATDTNLTFTTTTYPPPRTPQLFRAVSHNYIP